MLKEIINNKIIFTLITLFLFSILSILLFKDIGTRKIEEWDEQTNIEVIRESIDKEYLTYKGEVFLEKPPLWYYIGIAGNRFIGDNIIVYRSIGAISSLIGILLLYILLLKRSGRFNSLVFLISILCIRHLYFIDPSGYFSTHTLSSADLDALQIFFIILSFFLINILNKPGKIIITLSYLSLSLGFLAKGPLILLPLVLNTWLLLQKGISKKDLLLHLTVFLIPILFWFIIMLTAYDQLFIDKFLNYHILNRAFTTLEGHNEPWWFYLQLFLDPRINLLGLPFIFVIGNKLKRDKNILVKYYLLSFIILSLLLITLMNTRLAWYLLPVYPFLSFFLCL